ncbi:BCCT family transporter [Ruania alkalisoli]|uniref:BCCT family transporter n=1 Tax=Ruania alkalisoli TaxID=2779775 RepID=A0A7M1SRS4_9MICO|nr:BCCT family transporter [Ruania alkalisoli]QOR70256.1 BCCT family transporter [Ruania alkalisoli]
MTAEVKDKTPPPPEDPDRSGPWYSSVRPGVFWPSMVVIAAFVIAAIAGGSAFGDAIGVVSGGIVTAFGWYYIVLVTAFVGFAVWVGVSHYGDIVLGDEDEPAEFKMGPWLAMLFAAGMGIGLMFWGVAEPLHHFAGIPNRATGIAEMDAAGAEESLVTTFLHWGLHPWAIYVVVGLAIAYAVHVRKRPISIRWSLEAILGKRTDSWIGNVIDVIAVVGTVFGVATSLGLGVSQVASGLSFLEIIGEPTNLIMVFLIGIITLIALVSVVTGVKKGIKYLSNGNMILAIGLMIFVLIAGPTMFLLREYVEATGLYFQEFLNNAFRTTAFAGEDGTTWQGWWTAFYWGWWVSWAPFVGVFIARISRGRTVREFVVGVLVLPTAFSFLWFTVFGGTALHRQLFGEGGLVTEGGPDDTVGPEGLTVDGTGSLFTMLDGLVGEPGSGVGKVLVGLAVLLVVIFFVTSSDSGSLVVDMLASGGDPEPPKWSRVLWAILEGAVASALLLAGGSAVLSALQSVAISIALPFSIIMIFMCVALIKQFRSQRARMLRAQRRIARDELTDHVSTSFIEDGLLDPPPAVKRKLFNRKKKQQQEAASQSDSLQV